MANPAFSLAGRTAIVTGSSKGIGFAAARAMGLAGAKVVISSRKAENCQAAREALAEEGIEALAVPGHAAREDDIANIIGRALEHFGRLDILVANAAINPTFDPLAELAEESWNRILETNLTGPLRLARHGLQHLGPGGSMVMVSSVNAAAGFKGGGPYGISKAGLEQMTRQLAIEWGASGIRVNAVRPSTTRTDMIRVLMEKDGFQENLMATTPLRRIAEPEDVGNVVAFLASDSARHMTGQVLTIDGGQSILRGQL